MKTNQNLAPEILEKRGTWFAVLSGFLYGLLGFFGVSLIKSGFSVFNVSFWRFFFAFLFLLVVYLAKRAPSTGSFRQCFLVMINGAIFYAIPGTLFFISSRYIGTGQAMVIFFIFPVFVMLLNWIFLKQPIKPYYCLSFVVILAGLTLLVDLSEINLDLWGIFLSLAAAFSYAIYVFISKKISGLPALNLSLMVTFGCSLHGLVLSLIDGNLAMPSNVMQLMYIIGIGIICSALPILFLFEALKYITSDKAALLSVLEPVFVVIFGILLLGEHLKLTSIFGIILTLLGAMSIVIKWKMPKLLKAKHIS